MKNCRTGIAGGTGRKMRRYIYSPYSAQEVKNMTEQIFQSQETGQRKVSADFEVKDFDNSESIDVSKFMKVCREHFLGLPDKPE